MSDRITIATTVFIAGIMFGAFTVQLKDQLSLHLGTLGFKNNHAMLGDGTINSPAYMSVSIAVLLIVVAALTMAAIHRFIDSFVLATLLQLVLLAAVVTIFISLR
jgi:hypothetical protein